jgi:hypothetical protein
MQNLNLYQVEKQSRSGPQPKHMLLGLLLLLLALLLHSAWQGWQLYQGGKRLALAEAAAQSQETEFAAAKAGFREPVLDASLPKALADQEAQNRQLQRLFDYLQLLGNQQSSGFVAPLAALAEQHPPSGLWLSDINLRDGGSVLRLRGSVVRTPGSDKEQQLLPEYLQRLGRSPVFAGREFARFDVERNDSGVLRFDLSSQAKEQDEGKAQ